MTNLADYVAALRVELMVHPSRADEIGVELASAEAELAEHEAAERGALPDVEAEIAALLAESKQARR